MNDERDNLIRNRINSLLMSISNPKQLYVILQIVSILYEVEEDKRNVELKSKEELLNRSISTLKIKPKTVIKLESHGITTIGEFTEKSEAELLRIKSIWFSSLENIERSLFDVGLRLKFIDDKALEVKKLHDFKIKRNRNVIEKIKSVDGITHDELLNLHVNKLDVKTSTLGTLEDSGIMTIKDLLCKTEIDLLRTPRIGRSSLDNIKEVLSKLDLYLAK